jgi:peptide chain release factor subunit 1
MNKELYLKSSNHDIVTIYIKPDSLDKMRLLIDNEKTLLENIKSKQTRNGIREALNRVTNLLNILPISNNGYLIVASQTEAVVETSVMITQNKYWCGNEFYGIPYEESISHELNPIGIILLDAKESTLGYVDNNIQLLKNIESGVQGKHDKGGQSQRRYERQREQKILSYFYEVAEASKVFLTLPITNLLLGGPGLTKEEFIKSDLLDYRLREKILDTVDTQYTGEEGLREIFRLSIPILEKNAYALEVKAVEDFFNFMGKNMDKIYYSMNDILSNINLIDKVIQIEGFTIQHKNCITLRFHGEHYDKIRSLGGIVGMQY